MNDGILLIDKRTGLTSFSSLSLIKKTVNRKAGHTGTLDKFASGLLIVLTGSFTRFNELFSGLDKTYEAVFSFGRETDTLDPEGETVGTSAVAPDDILLERIRDSVKKNFTGKVFQHPPLYSAIHIDGKRAHEIARSGQSADVPGREIEIYDFEITGYTRPDLSVRIHVSKGTYIRSIARDLARSIGERAYVTELRRISVGPFSVKEATDETDSDRMHSDLTGSFEKLLRLPTVERKDLSEDEIADLSCGRNVLIDSDKPWIIAYSDGKARGIIKTDKGKTCHSICLI